MAWVENAYSGYSARLCQECGRSTPVDVVGRQFTDQFRLGELLGELRVIVSDYVPEDSVIVNRALFERCSKPLEPRG